VGEVADSEGAKRALEALNTPRNHAKPYNILSPILRPELKSDLKSKASESYRVSNETKWSSGVSRVSSLFGLAPSGTSSAATSPPTSKDFDETFKQARAPAPPLVSRWSTATVDSTNQSSSDGPDHFVNRGAVYALVQESTKTGLLRGAVDVSRKEILHEKWSKRIWHMIECPESFLEVFSLNPFQRGKTDSFAAVRGSPAKEKSRRTTS
jgi:hypothetical protein